MIIHGETLNKQAGVGAYPKIYGRAFLGIVTLPKNNKTRKIFKNIINARFIMGTHECSEMKNSSNRCIDISKDKSNNWIIMEYIDDAVIYNIQYCPFCGVRLTD
jgi:hypothetical protein